MRTTTIISLAVGLGLSFATIARADETVIKKNEPSTTIIKKKHEPSVLPVPHEHDKTSIKKENE